MSISEKKLSSGYYRVISIPAGIAENNPKYQNLTWVSSKGIVVSEYIPVGRYSNFNLNGQVQVYIGGQNSASTTLRQATLTSASTRVEFDLKPYMAWNQVGAPESMYPSNTPSIVWATGKKFVMVGVNTSPQTKSQYSTDGITWTATNINNASSGAVEATIWYAGDKYYNLRTINQYSSDGMTFTNMASRGVNGTPSAIAFNAGTYVLVNGSTAVATSGDGVNWTTRGSALAGAPSSGRAAASLPGATFPILFGGGSGLNGTSNGVTWTSIPLPGGQAVNQIVSDGSQYITAGDNSTCATSPNGSTWTIRTTYPAAAGNGWRSIGFGNSSSGIKYMLGTQSGDGINVSTDSITWTTRLIWTTTSFQFSQVVHGGPGAGAWLLYGTGGGFSQGWLYWSTTTWARTSIGQDLHLFVPNSTIIVQ